MVSQVVVLDSDMLTLRPLDSLFEWTRKHDWLHHHLIMVRVAPPPLHRHEAITTITITSEFVARPTVAAYVDCVRLSRLACGLQGHHAYDKAQSVCGLPVGHRVNGGLLLLRPDLAQFEETLLYVKRAGSHSATWHWAALPTQCHVALATASMHASHSSVCTMRDAGAARPGVWPP